MIQLIKLAFKQPMQAMVIALCLGVTTMHMGLMSVGVAIADLEVKSEVHANIGKQVILIKEMLIRNEQTVLYLKKDAEHLREGQKRMLDHIANTTHYPN